MNITLLKKLGVIGVIIVIYLLVCKKVFHRLENKSEIFFENIKSKQKSKIYDIIHNNLPSTRKLMTIVDATPFILLVVILFIDVNLFYNIMGFLVTIFIFRMFIIHITILPKDKKCDIKKSSLLSGGCYDKIYSGHFSAVFMCLLSLYMSKYINLFTLLSLSTIFALLIITSRSHYTIDIFVAFLIVVVVYQNNINVCRIIDKFVK
jgi:hypothetical protein